MATNSSPSAKQKTAHAPRLRRFHKPLSTDAPSPRRRSSSKLKALLPARRRKNPSASPSNVFEPHDEHCRRTGHPTATPHGLAASTNWRKLVDQPWASLAKRLQGKVSEFQDKYEFTRINSSRTTTALENQATHPENAHQRGRRRTTASSSEIQRTSKWIATTDFSILFAPPMAEIFRGRK